MPDDLGSILNPQEEEVETEQEETATATQEETAAETGVVETQVAAETQETAQEQKPEEDPAAQVRAKLAAAEKERDRMREKARQLEQEKQQREAEAAKQKPDFWEDPEARLSEVEQRMEQRLQRERLNISEMYARGKHEDYQDKVDAFAELVKDNPALYHQMLQQENPAEFAYKTASNHLKLKEMGDPQEYAQKLESELRAKIKAEMEADYEAKKTAEVEAAIKAKLGKGGFSEVRSVGNHSTKQTYSGPTPLGSILK